MNWEIAQWLLLVGLVVTDWLHLLVFRYQSRRADALSRRDDALSRRCTLLVQRCDDLNERLRNIEAYANHAADEVLAAVHKGGEQ